jgi:hypothetical protein
MNFFKVLKIYIKRKLNNFFDKKNYMVGLSHIMNMRYNYKNIQKLNDLDYKIFSQNGEDGIIDYFLYTLNIENPKFVEIGIGDYSECNTRFLFERTSCKGLIIDNLNDLQNRVARNIKLWKSDLTIVETSVNSKNILNILKKNNFEENIDLFSIDIDGIDYWVLKELPVNFSKIAVIEYNAIFGPDLEVTVPNIDNFNRAKYHYSHLCFGASLKSLINLMTKKNFIFLGTNLTRCNAFFISKDYLDKINLQPSNLENIYQNTDSNIRESRSKNGDLNYLSGENRLKEIKNCEVINVKNSENNLTKLSNLF